MYTRIDELIKNWIRTQTSVNQVQIRIFENFKQWPDSGEVFKHEKQKINSFFYIFCQKSWGGIIVSPPLHFILRGRGGAHLNPILPGPCSTFRCTATPMHCLVLSISLLTCNVLDLLVMHPSWSQYHQAELLTLCVNK
jgi:hypothetical protein